MKEVEKIAYDYFLIFGMLEVNTMECTDVSHNQDAWLYITMGWY